MKQVAWNYKYILRVAFFFFAASLFVVPIVSQAARIYLDPADKEVSLKDTFLVNIRIDNEGECVNALDVKIAYDNKILDAVDFSRGESLVTLWVKTPTIDHSAGTISFSGGIPGGYCGRVVGDPGLSNILGKIAFTATGNKIEGVHGDITQVSILPSTQVLLNDGRGTPANLTTKGATFTIASAGKFVKNEWLEEINKDTIPPEKFKIRIHQNLSIKEGKYFIVFTTNDKQSGIDHFEVFEGSKKKSGYEVGTNKPAQWRKVERDDPYYVLRDQTLSSKVLVKAIDKAGNEQLAELNTEDISHFSGMGFVEKFFLTLTIILIIAIFFLIVLRLRKKSHRSRTIEEKASLQEEESY